MSSRDKFAGAGRRTETAAALLLLLAVIFNFAGLRVAAQTLETSVSRAPESAGKGGDGKFDAARPAAEQAAIGTCDTPGPVEIESTGGTTAPTAYAALKDAFDAVNAGTHTGVVTIEVCGDTTETAPAVLNASGSGAALYTSLLVRPTGGAARTVSGAIVAGSPLIDLNGADNVTINGLNAGGNSLTIANTTVSATSGTATVRFIGGATGNTITNATILGAASASVATNGATIFFSTDAVTANGNDDNTISNNNIGPAGGNLPSKAILGNGSTGTTAIGNSGITISNNNIYDFFAAAVTSAGVATNGGCNAWTITNNRFYQTATRTWTTGAVHTPINIANTTATSGAQGFTITGNTIGFATSSQTGVYTLTGSTGIFRGIVYNGITGGALTTISGNTVSAVSLTGVTASGTSTSSPFIGMLIQNGLVTSNNNTIGSQTATGALTFTTTTTTATDVYGIYNFSLDDWNAAGNTVGGIAATNLGASGTFLLFAVRVNTSTSKAANLTDNLVGGTVANSIQLAATGTGSQVVGIQTTNAAANWTRNTVRNLTTNIGTGTTTSASVIGMNVNSATPSHTLSQNTITALANTNATAASVVTGIQFTGAAANLVERNVISNLAAATTSASAEVNGIRVSGGTTVYRNNMINLGAAIPNAVQVNGFNEFLGTNTVYHNSIYVGGTAAAGTGNSFAFNGQQTVNTRAFRNNIFFNARANAGATGKHYAVRVGGSSVNPAGLTVNNNVYFANGAGAVFGLFNANDVSNLAAWQAAVGQDANSFEANPLFVSATDLHLQAGSPAIDQAANLGVTNDVDGKSRPGANALFDIGADERDGIAPVANDVQATALVDPANGGVKAVGQSFAPQASFANLGTNAQSNVPVRYRICADAGCSSVLYNNTATIPALGIGAAATVTFAATSLATPGTYTIRARAELATDTVPANDEIVGTLAIQPPLAGTFSVGAGGDFASLTNPGGIFDALNNTGASGNIVINLTSDLTGETGAVALNELAGGFSVLIKPAGGPRLVQGSVSNALIRINGADNVRIDGSTGASLAETEPAADNIVGGNPNLRQLTIQNTNAGTTTGVIAVQSGANGAQNVTIQNVNVLGQDSTTTLLGIGVGGTTPGTVGADNDNVRIVNCSVRRTIYGIYAAGLSAVNPNTGNVIRDNSLEATRADRVRRVAILVFNQDGVQITDNSVGGLDTNESADAIGIGVGTQTVDTTNVTAGGIFNALVARNKVNGVVSSSATGFSAAGIAVAGSAGGANLIANNLITGVRANSTSPDFPVGIYVIGAAGGNTRIVHNTVAMTGDRGATAAQMPSYALAITGTDPAVELKNNVFYTTQISGGGAAALSYAVGTASTTFVNLDSNFNAFFSAGANDGGFRTGSLAISAGTTIADLAGWQTAVADDASSVEVDPLLFNPLNDGHLTATSPVRNIGTPIAGVTNDYDGQARPNPNDSLVVQVDIGGDEFYVPTAANVSLEGRLVTAGGQGIRGATVMIAGGGLAEPLTARTGTFGAYRFEGLRAGETYVVTVVARRYTFANPSVVVTLSDNVADLNFTADDK